MTRPYTGTREDVIAAYREDVIAEYRKILHTEGILPTQDENKNLYRLRTEFFQSEKEVVEAAGFDYEFLREITDRVRRMRREGIESAGYYEAITAMHPHLKKYGREGIEKYMGKHPARGEIYERMGESETPGPENISPAEHWKRWQQYYKKKFYSAPAEGEIHEEMFADMLMRSESPGAAIVGLSMLSKKYPSSVGADMGEEFRQLWIRTRGDVLPPKRRLAHPGYIQIERQKKAG